MADRVYGPNFLNQQSHTAAQVGVTEPSGDAFQVLGADDGRVFPPNYLHPYPHTGDGLSTLTPEQTAARKIAALHPAGTPHGDMFRRDNAHLL